MSELRPPSTHPPIITAHIGVINYLLPLMPLISVNFPCERICTVAVLLSEDTRDTSVTTFTFMNMRNKNDNITTLMLKKDKQSIESIHSENNQGSPRTAREDRWNKAYWNRTTGPSVRPAQLFPPEESV